jgi:hypothetical protein
MVKLMTLWVLLICSTSWGGAYYVDKGNAGAQNTNTGTEAQPWLTIQYGVDQAQPGDTVYVKTGSYNETILTKRNGTAIGKIVIKSLPRRMARTVRFMMANEYVRVEGFELTLSTPAVGINITAGHTEVVDNYIYNMSTGIIVAYNRANIYLAHNRIYHCQYGLLITGTRVLAEYNEVERMFQYNTAGDADYCRFFGDTITFRGNNFHGTMASEIGNAHLDCWQTFDDNGEHAVNVLWDGNWCSECAEGVMAGCTLGSASHDFTFVNNVFAHSWSWGLCMGIISNTLVYNNVFYDIYNHAIGGFAGATNIVVKNNIFSNAGSGYWTEQGAPLIGDYNLMYQTSNPGVVGAHNKLGVDPQFVNAAGNDFHLKSTSPAINAGTVVPLTTDRDGNVRPYNGAYNMGAYEYGAPPVSGLIYNQGRITVSTGKHIIPNPLSIMELRSMGKTGRYIAYVMNGQPVLLQVIRSKGVYVLQDTQTGMTQKIVVIK